jgi:cobalt-zinc-cadmium efflux system outer membrane protein
VSKYLSAALVGAACLAGVLAAPEAHAQASAETASDAVLTRGDAIARALADDPGVAASEAAQRAAEAGVGVAGRRPNPTLDVLVENVAGSGAYGGFGGAETTSSLSQPLELGGDRAARRALAESDLDAARIGGDLRRLDLALAVEIAFVDAQATEMAQALAEERLEIERALAETAARRVREARDPAVVSARAEARLAEAEVAVDAARQAAEAARSRLASWWGGEADLPLELASFERLAEPTESGLDASPELALADVGLGRAEAALDLERARGVPDPSVEAGLRHFGETDETAFVVGFSLALPVWNDNSDAVARARAERQRAAREIEASTRALERERDRLAAMRDAGRLEAEGLEDRVIPQAEEALAAALDAYARGGLSYLEVVEAQTALGETRLRRVDALRSFHHAEAGLARLAGARVAPVPTDELSR